MNLACLWRKFQIFVPKHEYHSEDSKDAHVVLSNEDQPYLSDQAIKKSLKTRLLIVNPAVSLAVQ